MSGHLPPRAAAQLLAAHALSLGGVSAYEKASLLADRVASIYGLASPRATIASPPPSPPTHGLNRAQRRAAARRR